MSDFLASAYPWFKSLHIMAMIAWMAGLFYLPRLFVYHAENSEPGDSKDKVFQTMEYKLLKVIMNPAMTVTWIMGVLLLGTPGIVDWTAFWPYVKIISVIAMTIFHIWLGKRRKFFVTGENTMSGRQYRLMNEVPTVLMVVIVLAVVVKF